MKKHIGLIFCLSLPAAYISCTKKAEAEIKPSVKTAVGQSGIFSRKTSRVYDASKQISDSDLQLILKAAFASPTADNSRAAEFIVVQDRNKIINLKEGNPYTSQLNTAPTVIVIAVNEKTIVHNDLAALDAGIAAQSIMIQAAELGYASVPMSIAPQETRVKNTRSVLGLPNYVTPYIMVVVGFPAADAVTSASTDYWNDSKVHKNGW
nr:nitroreductase family protein [Treponema socranskii]